MPKELIVFIEGNDDDRFFEKIIEPRIMRAKFSKLTRYPYAQRPDKQVNAYLKNLKSGAQEYYEYIFVADKDEHPNAEDCKRSILERYPDADPARIFMVCAEIESWYFAGLTQDRLRELGIHADGTNTTDELTKEMFNALIPTRYKDSRILFLIEILACYNISHARVRNISFDEFCTANRDAIESKPTTPA